MVSQQAEMHETPAFKDARIWVNVDIKQADTIDSPRVLGP